MLYKGKRIGSGTASHYLRGHNMDVERYISKHYTPYDEKIIKNFLLNNPREAKSIIEDFLRTSDAKIDLIINELGYGKSKICIIVGARGGGKTALSMFLLKQLHQLQQNETFYFVGEDINKDLFPSWIKVAPNIEKVPDYSTAVVDEAALKYSSRRSMEDENVLISGLIATARHHDLTIIFITQHLGLIDLNIYRMRDLIFYVRSSDYEIGERGGKSDKQSKGWQIIRTMMMPREIGECLTEIPSRRRFINFKFELPEFWNDDISKVFRGHNAREKMAAKRKEIIEGKLDYYRKKQEIRAEILANKGIKEINKEDEFPESGVK